MRSVTQKCINCEFQSTLPREERHLLIALFLCIKNFNPRSHERSDYIDCQVCKGVVNFNPRSHERSDSCHYCTNNFHKYFNPRSHERSDVLVLLWLSVIFNFNPRSHERSDISELLNDMTPDISIHAPTRGATNSSHSLNYSGCISIHAPTRGAT